MAQESNQAFGGAAGAGGILGGTGGVSDPGGILKGQEEPLQEAVQAQGASLEAQESNQALEARLEALHELEEMFFRGAPGAGGILQGAPREAAWDALCRLNVFL